MSDQYFIQLNRSIMELYDRGHLMSAGEMAISLNSIATNAHRMVDRRRQAFNFPPHNQYVSIRTLLGRSHTPPRPPPPEPYGPAPPPENVRPAAELRPADAIPSLTPDKHKILPRAAFEADCAEVCAICLETHKKGESLTTCCGHEFGKDCYRSWIFSTASNHKCPTCRTVNPKYTTYSKRVYRAPQRQNNVVNVVENNVV